MTTNEELTLGEQLKACDFFSLDEHDDRLRHTSIEDVLDDLDNDPRQITVYGYTRCTYTRTGNDIVRDDEAVVLAVDLMEPGQ